MVFTTIFNLEYQRLNSEIQAYSFSFLPLLEREPNIGRGFPYFISRTENSSWLYMWTYFIY